MEDNEEMCIMNRFIRCTLHQILLWSNGGGDLQNT